MAAVTICSDFVQDNNVRTIARDSLARIPLLEKLHLDDNSVSTVSIEEDAFADSKQLKLLFLSRNHLSSIPSGLPRTLEELRLDDNRISTIPLHAFKGLSSLRRLVLDVAERPLVQMPLHDALHIARRLQHRAHLGGATASSG